jgi:Dolichyl-phosphate-mannose-protein mannosyltransferase
VSQKQYELLSGGRSKIDWVITGLMVSVFIIGMVWFTRGNRYASFYDTQEQIRATQEIGKEWDLHRPLLSAVTTKVVKKALQVPDDVQAVVEIGRTVSAFFAVGSIVALCLIVYFLESTTAAALLAVLLLCQHGLFAIAHRMTESSSLLFGASMTLLAIVLLEQKPTVPRSLFLGVSVALAVSAKYIGALLIIPALVAVVQTGGGQFRVNRVVEFALGLLFAILVVNFYAVTELPVAAMDVLQDLGAAFASTPQGLKALVHGTYWLDLWHNTTPAIWIMITVSLWLFWVRRYRLRMSEILLALIPLVYFMLLLFAPTGDLRFLPMIGFTYAFAVVGVSSMTECLGTVREEVRGWLVPLLIGVCLVACFFEFLRGYPYYAAFNRDERLEMLDWINGNIQPGSKILADPTVLLPKLLAQSKQKYRFAVATQDLAKFKQDQSEVDQVAAAGVDYVVASPADYREAFSSTGSIGTATDQSTSDSKQFYSELFKRGTLVWKREPGPVPFLQPGLEIYHLPKPLTGTEQGEGDRRGENIITESQGTQR